MSSSHSTYLCMNNQTPWSMTMTVNQVDDYDWDKGTSARPDQTFNNVTLPPETSSNQREELNAKAKSSHFNMTCTFSNGDVVSFYDDQYEAMNGISPNPRVYPLSGASASLFTLMQYVDTSTRTSTFTLTPNMNNWVGALPDNLLLSHITIPGTHDSGATADASTGKIVAGMVGGGVLGAYGVSTAYASAKCQSTTITQQLQIGIRALDIRCTIDGSNMVLCHGVINQGTTLRSVFDQCKAFLAANPREIIFMSLKSDAGDSTEVGQGIVGLTYDYPGLFYVSDVIPALWQVRGKIVVGRRFPYPRVWGLDLNSQWEDNACFQMSYVGRNGQTQNFYVQDVYNLANASDKWAQVANCLNTTGARSSSGVLTLNFASAVGNNWMSVGIPDPQNMASAINSDLTSSLLGVRGSYGIILMDFPTGQEVAEIVGTNS